MTPTRQYSNPYGHLTEQLQAKTRDLNATTRYRLYVESLTNYCMQGLGYC